MDFRVLGPLQVVGANGVPIDLPGASLRRLTCMLLVRDGTVVPADALAEGLGLSLGALRTSVSRLRRVVGYDTVATVPPGFVLRADTVDARDFEQRLAAAAAAAGDSARRALEEALALWRGDAYVEFAHEEWAITEATRLAELRTAAVEDLVELMLDAHEWTAAIATLEPLVVAHPYRDRPRGLMMRALAGSGRRIDALRAFQDYRTSLIEELGTEPSDGIALLDREIARSGATDLVPTWSPSRAAADSLAAFLVTDIVGSTRLWAERPEAMSVDLAVHDDVVSCAIADHHGTTISRAGDSFTAVFERPCDAVAAAVAAQEFLAGTAWQIAEGIHVRMGVHLGAAQRRGDGWYGPPLNEAARITSSAHGGQIVVSEPVTAMVPEIAFFDLGRHRLPDLDGARRLFQVVVPGLERDFPPLRTVDTPTNLPVRISTFVGREPELASLAELQAANRLVTITGSGGAGKSSLALQAASSQVDRYRDGVWWLELAPLVEGAQVARAMAKLLDARVDDATPAVEAIVRRLGRDDALIVLDNCEHLIDAAATLAAVVLQHCPNVSIVATSRSVLGVAGEVTWRVPPLSFPPVGSGEVTPDWGEFDAVQLFADRARRVRPSFALSDENRPAVVEICQRLDGIPLAIELAAARTKSLTLAHIHDGLEHQLLLLTGGSRTSPPRHQTLQASIAWSVALLADREGELLHRLSIFSGSFDLPAVEAICSQDDRAAGQLKTIEVIDSLDRLIDHSLVLALDGDREGRFMQLETVRQFGEAHLEREDSSAELRRRHAEYFAELARTVAPMTESADELTAVERLDADIDNLRAALVWYRDCGDADALAAMVCDLALYWSLTGAMAESLTWLTCALDALPDQPSVIRARLSAHRGSVRSNMGDYSGSIRDCQRAIALGEEVGDSWPVGRGNWTMAELAAYVDLDMWRPLSERSIEALSASGDRYALGYARLWQAVPYLMRGNQPEGIAALEAAAAAIHEVGNPTLNASHKIWQGWAALQAGELRRTDELANEVMNGPGFRLATQQLFGELLLAAAARYRGLHHPVLDEFANRVESTLRHGETLASVMYQYWESVSLLFTDPATALDRAREFIARHGDAYSSVACAVHLVAAFAALALGEREGSWSHLGAAEALTVPMKWPLNQTRQLLVRSMLLIEQGDIAAAETAARDEIVLARAQGLNIELVYGFEVLALIAAARDDFAETARLLGATSTMRDRMELAGNFLPLSIPVGHAVDRARTALGADAFGAAREAGAALTDADLLD